MYNNYEVIGPKLQNKQKEKAQKQEQQENQLKSVSKISEMSQNGDNDNTHTRKNLGKICPTVTNLEGFPNNLTESAIIKPGLEILLYYSVGLIYALLNTRFL